MRKLIWIIPLLCSLTFGQGGVIGPKGVIGPNGVIARGIAATGPTVLQAPPTCNGTTTCNITFGSPISAGSYILVYTGGNGNTTGISATMTGETITRLTGASGCSNNSGFEGDCFLATNAVGGQTVLTCTASTGASMACEAIEVSSPSAGHAKDVGGNAHAASTAMSVSTSAPNTIATDICIAMGFSPSGGSGFTALSWTSVINVNASNGNLLFEAIIPGSTGTQTATATANAGANIAEGVVCLKP